MKNPFPNHEKHYIFIQTCNYSIPFENNESSLKQIIYYLQNYTITLNYKALHTTTFLNILTNKS